MISASPIGHNPPMATMVAPFGAIISNFVSCADCGFFVCAVWFLRPFVCFVMLARFSPIAYQKHLAGCLSPCLCLFVCFLLNRIRIKYPKFRCWFVAVRHFAAFVRAACLTPWLLFWRHGCFFGNGALEPHYRINALTTTALWQFVFDGTRQ